MDLAVDEQGLWALWADTDNSYRLYASKIDVYSNNIIDTRALTTGNSMCVIYLQSGTSNLGHLYSRDTTFQGTQNLVSKNVHIIFVFVTSIEGTPLFTGKGHFFWVPKGTP